MLSQKGLLIYAPVRGWRR